MRTKSSQTHAQEKPSREIDKNCLVLDPALVAALALGGLVDVGGIEGQDVAVAVSHDSSVDVVAVLALLEVFTVELVLMNREN
jgi:hypothetical protein